MLTHFLWRGQDSRDMELFIAQLPPIVRAKERMEELTIPGRAGHLTMLEGEDVYESYLKNCIVVAPSTADFQRLTSWLRGSGDVIFSNEIYYAYTARISGEVRFEKLSNSLKQATIPFFVQPYKKQVPKERPISFSGTSGTLRNPGDVRSKPIVKIAHTGDLEVTIGGITMAFSSLSSSVPITVDCGAEIISKNDGTIWQGTYGGDFWSIPTGISSISASTSCSLSIVPEWRWI